MSETAQGSILAFSKDGKMTSQSVPPIVLNPGDLDPMFGENGVVELLPGTATIRAMVEDKLGGIVYALWVQNEIWLSRVFVDGRPDLGFGQGGVTKWSFVPGLVSAPTQLILQDDGKILLIGAVRSHAVIGPSQIALTRFHSNGGPDLIFGNKILPFPSVGKITTDFPRGCLHNDGRILVAASYSLRDNQNQTIYEEIILHQLQANGDADLTFGGGRGFIEVRFNGHNSTFESVAVTKEGKILIAGTSDRLVGNSTNKKQAVTRLLSSGATDRTFGVYGCWEAEGVNQSGAMTLHGDNIVVVGFEITGPFKACISQLTADGVYDPEFNGGKRLLIDIPADQPGWFVWCHYVALQGDGKIVAAGYAGDVTQSFLLRVHTNGEVDSGFADEGVRMLEPSSLWGGLLVQKQNQRIVVGLDSANYGEAKLVGVVS
jgi:uncharacterized delta-60 repeat protein